LHISLPFATAGPGTKSAGPSNIKLLNRSGPVLWSKHTTHNHQSSKFNDSVNDTHFFNTHQCINICIPLSAVVRLNKSHGDKTAFDTVKHSSHDTDNSLTKPETIHEWETKHHHLDDGWLVEV